MKIFLSEAGFPRGGREEERFQRVLPAIGFGACGLDVAYSLTETLRRVHHRDHEAR